MFREVTHFPPQWSGRYLPLACAAISLHELLSFQKSATQQQYLSKGNNVSLTQLPSIRLFNECATLTVCEPFLIRCTGLWQGRLPNAWACCLAPTTVGGMLNVRVGPPFFLGVYYLPGTGLCTRHISSSLIITSALFCRYKLWLSHPLFEKRKLRHGEICLSS